MRGHRGRERGGVTWGTVGRGGGGGGRYVWWRKLRGPTKEE